MFEWDRTFGLSQILTGSVINFTTLSWANTMTSHIKNASRAPAKAAPGSRQTTLANPSNPIKQAVYDIVDDASEASFPASDPPSYMGKIQAGSPNRFNT